MHTMYLLWAPCPLRKRCFFVHCTQYLEAARPADAAALQVVWPAARDDHSRPKTVHRRPIERSSKLRAFPELPVPSLPTSATALHIVVTTASVRIVGFLLFLL